MKTLGTIFILVTALLAMGCGGAMESTQNSMMQPAAAAIGPAALRVNFGSTPPPPLAALDVTVNSIELLRADGQKVSLLSSPARFELTHAAGTVDPLLISNIPAGSYTGVAIAMSNGRAMMMDPSSRQVTQRNVSMMSNSATTMFGSPVTMGSSPMAMNCTFNGTSMSFDAMGNASMTPRFEVTTMMMAGMYDQRPEDGAMEDMPGFVTAINGSSFTMSTAHMTQTLTFSTDNATRFEGIGGMGAMRSGMMVEVDSVTRPDGTLMATKVEMRMDMANGMMNNAMEARGVLTEVTGTPVSQLKVVMHRAMSPGSMMHDVSGELTVTLTAETKFKFDPDRVDLSGLPFTPRFEVATMARGQVLAIESDQGMGSMMGGSTVAARTIELEQQALTGTISGYTENGQQATFTLQLPPDSFLTALGGVTQVTVFKQPRTELRNITTLANGAAVRVRGLLFYDGGNYKLVASRVMSQ